MYKTKHTSYESQANAHKKWLGTTTKALRQTFGKGGTALTESHVRRR